MNTNIKLEDEAAARVAKLRSLFAGHGIKISNEALMIKADVNDSGLAKVYFYKNNTGNNLTINQFVNIAHNLESENGLKISGLITESVKASFKITLPKVTEKEIEVFLKEKTEKSNNPQVEDKDSSVSAQTKGRLITSPANDIAKSCGFVTTTSVTPPTRKSFLITRPPSGEFDDVVIGQKNSKEQDLIMWEAELKNALSSAGYKILDHEDGERFKFRINQFKKDFIPEQISASESEIKTETKIVPNVPETTEAPTIPQNGKGTEETKELRTLLKNKGIAVWSPTIKDKSLLTVEIHTGWLRVGGGDKAQREEFLMQVFNLLQTENWLAEKVGSKIFYRKIKSEIAKEEKQVMPRNKKEEPPKNAKPTKVNPKKKPKAKAKSKTDSKKPEQMIGVSMLISDEQIMQIIKNTPFEKIKEALPENFKEVADAQTLDYIEANYVCIENNSPVLSGLNPKILKTVKQIKRVLKVTKSK